MASETSYVKSIPTPCLDTEKKTDLKRA